jgi:5-methylcytosine-specific restriction endonuclease McrA
MRRAHGDLYATRDHEIPECRGGGNGGNVVLSCQRCNNTKGDMTGDEFRDLLRTRTMPQSYVDYLARKKLALLGAS